VANDGEAAAAAGAPATQNRRHLFLLFRQLGLIPIADQNARRQRGVEGQQHIIVTGDCCIGKGNPPSQSAQPVEVSIAQATDFGAMGWIGTQFPQLLRGFRRKVLEFCRPIWVYCVMSSVPDDHIYPRRSALFMARSVLRELRAGGRPC